MRVHVHMFGPVRDQTGVDCVEQDLQPDADIAALEQALLRRFPTLRPELTRLRFAVNQTFVGRDFRLSDGDEVALIPPVSGG